MHHSALASVQGLAKTSLVRHRRGLWRKRRRTARSRLRQFLPQPFQTPQVLFQGLFGIGLLPVINNPDRPLPAALVDDPHHTEFLIAFSQMKDFAATLVPVHLHAVEVHREQMWHHLFPEVREAREVRMAVVKVVHDPDVLYPVAG